MEQLLTLKQVAEILQVNYRKVLELIVLGRIASFRVGNQYRIKERDLYRYLDSVRVESIFIMN